MPAKKKNSKSTRVKIIKRVKIKPDSFSVFHNDNIIKPKPWWQYTFTPRVAFLIGVGFGIFITSILVIIAWNIVNVQMLVAVSEYSTHTISLK